jgi:hypothetical protein
VVNRPSIIAQSEIDQRQITLGLCVDRFAALPRQAMKGIDHDWPWKSLR